MDTLIKRIIHLAQSNPDKMAAAFKKERLTYSELADKIINNKPWQKRNRETKVNPLAKYSDSTIS